MSILVTTEIIIYLTAVTNQVRICDIFLFWVPRKAWSLPVLMLMIINKPYSANRIYDSIQKWADYSQSKPCCNQTLRYNPLPCFLVVNYCKDIIALDSNGLSDPYIVWDLCPRHIFRECPEHKTTIKKKTLNPIYDEVFQWWVLPMIFIDKFWSVRLHFIIQWIRSKEVQKCMLQVHT